MFRHILLSFRRFRNEKQFSLLNIIGLSTGLAFAILIYLWVKDEKSVDAFHANNDRIYQVIKTAINGDGTIETHETTPGNMARLMKDELPEVEKSVPVFMEREKGIIRAGDQVLKAAPIWAGREFFNIFSYGIVGSNPHTEQDPSAIFISEELAKKLFGKIEVVGMMVDWEGESELSGAYKIGGVFKTPPSNSSVQFDVVFAWEHYYNTYKSKYGLDLWYSNSPYTYLLLKPGVDELIFNKKIENYSRDKMLAMHGKDNLEYEGKMFAQRYADKYLYNKYVDGKIAGGRIEYVNLFSIVAVFILLLACINFMNLATAKSATRMKEAGIRKIVGARKLNLIIEFISESVVMTLISLAIAGGIVALLLPYFNTFAGKQIEFPSDVVTIGTLISIAIVTGIFSGSYPAIFIARVDSLKAIKSGILQNSGRLNVRKSLVVFQFTMSIIFIVAVITVHRQMKHIQQKNLGFEKDNVVYFSAERDMQMKLPAMFTEIKKINGVKNVTGMDGNMVGFHGGGGGIDWPGKKQPVEFDGLYANYDWVETMGVKLVEGRSFSREHASDSNAVLFNEAAIKAMGLENPVGKKVKMWGKESLITGVMKDFHYESLYNRPGPMFVRFSPGNTSVLVKVAAGMERRVLEQVGELYTKFSGGLAFDYSFIDEDFDRMYASERRTEQLSAWFTGLAIVISCLGLFGLSAYTAQRREKEMGIRKVLGAAVHQVAMLLSSEFLRLVLFAIVISIPIAWWMMTKWLENFAYRVALGADIFIFAASFILFITVLTVSIQAVRVALINPARSLRAE